MGGTVEAAISDIAAKNGINRNALERVVWNESRGNPAVGKDRSQYTSGIAQISKVVWKTFSNLPYTYAASPKYYKQNLDVAAKYLKQLYNMYGDWTTALAAYNEGPGTMKQILNGQRGLSYITQNYIAGFNG